MKEGMIVCTCEAELFVQTMQDYVECPGCLKRLPVPAHFIEVTPIEAPGAEDNGIVTIEV